MFHTTGTTEDNDRLKADFLVAIASPSAPVGGWTKGAAGPESLRLHNTAPRKMKGSLHSKERLLPSKGSILPSKGSIPSTESLHPSKASLHPSKGSLLFSKGSLLPSTGYLLPSKGSVQRQNESKGCLPSKGSKENNISGWRYANFVTPGALEGGHSRNSSFGANNDAQRNYPSTPREGEGGGMINGHLLSPRSSEARLTAVGRTGQEEQCSDTLGMGSDGTVGEGRRKCVGPVGADEVSGPFPSLQTCINPSPRPTKGNVPKKANVRRVAKHLEARLRLKGRSSSRRWLSQDAAVDLTSINRDPAKG